MPQYDVDLRDYWRVLRKRKTLVILMVLLAGLSSYGFAKLKEPVPLYEATAAIKIERTTNLADFLTGGFWSQSESIVTHAFIITSFPVLEQTAKILGWIPEDLSGEETRNFQESLSVIRRLKSMVNTERESGTNIVKIRIISRDPQESANVANAFTKAYRYYNIQEKNKQTFDTKAFIEEQLRLTSNNLKQAEEKIRTFKEDYSLIALDAQTTNIINKFSIVETEIEKLKREKNQVLSQLRLIEKTRGSPENLDGVFFPKDTDSNLQNLSSSLHDLVLKRKSLLFDFTDKNPQVIEIDNQIQGVISEIKKELKALLRKIEAPLDDLAKTLDRLKKENQRLPEKELQLARLQREVQLLESLYSQLKAKYQETLIKESGKIEEVIIVRPAMVPTRPINITSKGMIVVTGIIIGLIIGIVFTFVAETLDTSIGTIEDVENLLNIPVLGVIPFWGKDEKKKKSVNGESFERKRATDLIVHYDPKSLAAEAFRSLRTNIQFVSLEQKGKSYLITSSFVQEGKTSNVVNLAISMAQAGDKVLLVEGDLRKSVIHKMFGVSRTPGLTDYVLGNYSWSEIVLNITDIMLGDFEIEEILKNPGLDNLNIMPGGTMPPNPSEILRSEKFHEFLQEAYREYDYIFIDAPPILPVTDATEIAPLVDGVFLVYKVGAIGRGILNRAKLSLDNINAKVLGVILNNIKPEVGPDYFKYHAHYYYGQPREIEGEKSSPVRKYFRLAVLLIAMALLALGIFWKDLPVIFQTLFSS